MKWRKYTIHTTVEAEDLVSMMLMELGAEGVEIEDRVPLSDADTKGMFIDILPDLGADDGTSRLSFYLHLKENDAVAGAADNLPENRPDRGVAKVLHDNKNCALHADNAAENASEDRSYTVDDRLWTEDEISELISNIRSRLDEMRGYINIGEGRIEEGVTEDTDWRDNWKQYFKPIRTGGFLIKPTWEEVPDEYAEDIRKGSLRLIEIDPGTAFGTGSHETTKLCLEAVEENVKNGDTVLDIGTGSGILGIAALKCGASFAAATELDEQCVSSINDNLRFNGIDEEKFSLFIGNVLGDEAAVSGVKDALMRQRQKNCGDAAGFTGYDICIANILAPVICLLAGEGAVDSLIKKGGIFITSGIIDEKLDDVIKAFEGNAAWEILKVSSMGEWRSVTVRRMP